jgi:hypothetical protein
MNIVIVIIKNLGEMVLDALGWALSKAPILLVIITPVITLFALWQAFKK